MSRNMIVPFKFLPLAAPFSDAGVNVVILDYDLCPSVSITRIIEEVRVEMRFGQ